MKNKKAPTKQQYVNFSRLGRIFLVLSPVAYILVPILFGKQLCAGDACGYANTGISAFALYAAAPLLIIGLILVIIGYFVNRK